MGTHKKGILGGFKGKTGTVIGSRWKDKAVMRSLPEQRSKRISQSQLEQREKFKLMIDFLSNMSDLLSFTFGSYTQKESGFNAAVSYNFNKAVMGSASPFYIDYSLTLLSRGFLLAASTAKAEAAAGNMVQFSWADNGNTAKSNPTDIAILIAYCPDTNRSVYVTDGATRSDLALALDTSAFAGRTVETWIAFRKEDNSQVSDSVYTGSIQLEP